MSIVLSDGTTSVDLHPDLYWSDELEWHPVEQRVERTITGAMIVSVAERLAGRPITLQPENESSAWMHRLTVEQLRNWAAVPGQQLTLTLRGIDRNVMFRHHDGSVIEATPIVHFSDVQDADWYTCTIRMMEV